MMGVFCCGSLGFLWWLFVLEPKSLLPYVIFGICLVLAIRHQSIQTIIPLLVFEI